MVLLAETVGTWTDKEVMIGGASLIGAILGVVVPGTTLAVRMATAFLRKKVRSLEVSTRQLEKERDEARDGEKQALKERDEIIRAGHDSGSKLTQAQAMVAHLKTDLARVQDDAKTTEIRLTDEVRSVRLSLTESQAALDASQVERKRLTRRISKAVSTQGRSWSDKARGGFSDFVPLAQRGAPIISVLNLKGGVGKTTLTANVAAALDHMGLRVLLLDLDLQGSLTGLFLNQADQQEYFEQDRLLAGFLFRAYDAEFPKLPEYVQSVLTHSGLVPTTDTLAYAENNLMVRWLLRAGRRDPRFLLRRELHLRRITANYDVVLLDCPPLLTCGCVNALTASDYLLIPIVPTKQATDRVPLLLSRAKELRETLNPEMKVLGVVPNRVLKADLTVDERAGLEMLKPQCRDAWGSDVYVFGSAIRQSAQVRNAENDRRTLRPEEDDAFCQFLNLAREIGERIPLRAASKEQV
jgi:cellulose biosynthesis protein BcsQ